MTTETSGWVQRAPVWTVLLTFAARSRIATLPKAITQSALPDASYNLFPVSAPLVSVITAAYNAAPFLADCIDSVRQQDFTDWEHVLVDDGSTDGTAEALRQAATQDVRCRPLSLPANRGVAEARNAAVATAQGRYLAFLDADDFWLPAKLGRQLEFMRARGAAISYTGFRAVSQDGTRLSPPINVPEQIDYKALLRRSAIVFSSGMVDTQQTGQPRFLPVGHDDYAMWLSLLRAGWVAHGLQEDLTRYRLAPGSLSRNKARSALWVWRIYRRQERLSLWRSACCLASYASHAVMKRRHFPS
jgi:teichuronic acid biosynthesis glycosyltransferase TuaG